MKQYIFDLEANGLKPTKIHCLSVLDVETTKVFSTTDYDKMRSFFQAGHQIIGHNACRYDIPVLERLLNVKINNSRYDTLGLSWYLFPDRLQHGLESWGEVYGVEKPSIDDWEELTPEEYIHRCEQDVRINHCLWKDISVLLKMLYGDDEGIARVLSYITEKMDTAALQEACRWKLDVPRCIEGRDRLLLDKEERIRQLIEIMPKVPKYKVHTKPKKCFKQSGELSEYGRKWFDLIKQCGASEDAVEVTVLSHYEDPKPTAPQQVKDFLFGLGWKPDEFKYVKDKETGNTRAIAQINKQTPGESGVTESVRLLFEKHPKLEVLDGLYVINHRLSILEGFLENVDDEGYIQAQVSGLTNTLRYQHKTVVNLPRIDKPYGDLIRGCLIAPVGSLLGGSDMSGLEDKIKQHYIYPHDPEYVERMMSPSYDAHLTLALFAKAITQEEYDGYTSNIPEVVKRIKPIRSVWKGGNYSAQYGAGGKKVALTTGVSESKGYEIIEAYWGLNWAIRVVADQLTVKKVNGQMWLWNPVAQLWYSLRHDKDKFSTLCQGTGAYCFDVWIRNVLKRRRQLNATFHDEGVWTIKEGEEETLRQILTDAINETNELLKLNIPLRIDIQFGETYADIH